MTDGKRILVAGGAGFLGTNLCLRLLEDEGNHVVCLDNFYTGRRENIEMLLMNPRFSLWEHDVTEPLTLDEAFDEIYNLACPASPPHYQKDPVYTTRVNVFGTMHLLDAARRFNAKFLQASTSEVYGDPAVHPQAEEYRGNVNCTGIRACYDEGKRCAESLVFDYARMYGVRVKVVRIFNTYGPYMDIEDGRVVSNFIVQALRGEPLTVYGTGEQTRSLCYVDDLLTGFLRVMATEDDFLGPLNLGNPEEYTVLELAEKIIAAVGSESAIIHCALPQDDPKCRRPDISRAEKKLGWHPTVSVAEGLQRTVQYFSHLQNVQPPR